MGEVVRLVLRHAIGLLHGEGGCVALREGNYLHVVAAAGVAELLAGVHVPLSGSIDGRAVNENTAVIVNDVAVDPSAYRPALRFANLHQAIVVPLATSRGPLGSLSVFNRADGFRMEDARVLQRLADQVAVAIVNARLFEEVTEATRAWTSTFDAIGIGLAIVDDAGRIVRYNGRARQLAAGAGRGELAGLPFYEAILGTSGEPNDRPLERSLRDGVMVRAVLEVPGVARRLQLTAAPHLDRGVIVTFDWASDPMIDASSQPGARHSSP
jgi:GAF domain-containing protein